MYNFVEKSQCFFNSVTLLGGPLWYSWFGTDKKLRSQVLFAVANIFAVLCINADGEATCVKLCTFLLVFLQKFHLEFVPCECI